VKVIFCVEAAFGPVLAMPKEWEVRRHPDENNRPLLTCGSDIHW
jgi:hypothetical protein